MGVTFVIAVSGNMTELITVITLRLSAGFRAISGNMPILIAFVAS